ncbi:hypothetical protein T11_16992 [Trichinella zimbabwensis]|uniref:Uncharacterized protein n=1 Tax=Trichinella zimbabwensis TaxID=268475 RepID=A0A0V1GBV3_9BILA|nr:hypothetical protein T11_16992 [Trichinella zimbabwensis]
MCAKLFRETLPFFVHFRDIFRQKFFSQFLPLSAVLPKNTLPLFQRCGAGVQPKNSCVLL